MNIDLQNNALTSSNTAVDVTDNLTDIFRVSQNIKNDFDVCYHRSNTIAKAVRGSNITNCLEFDVVVENEDIWVYHPPTPNVGLRYQELIDIASKNNLSIWIDAKNINTSENCNTLFNSLSTTNLDKKNVLIEFPPSTDPLDEEISECAKKFVSLGYSTSYYVPSDLSENCSKYLKTIDSETAIENQDCKSIERKLNAVIESNAFTDLSFSYNGIETMDFLEFSKTLKWNTWHIDTDNLSALEKNQYRMVITNKNDPNSR